VEKDKIIAELKETLTKLNGILDFVYEMSEEDEKEYICEVEDNLHNCLHELGILN
jgi:hypothetical protein